MKNNKKETKNINDEEKRLRHLIGVQRAQFKDDLEGHETLIKGLKKGNPISESLQQVSDQQEHLPANCQLNTYRQ